MTINITDETITNRNYIPSTLREAAKISLKHNNRKFCDLTPGEQTYFNWLLENEPKQCFWLHVDGTWRHHVHHLPIGAMVEIVVRINCEPEFEYLPITINKHGFYVIKFKGGEICPTCMLAHKDFAGFMTATGFLATLSCHTLVEINDKWTVKMRINQ